MRQVSQPELANIFFREIGGYLPKIELGISTLRHSATDKDTLGEVYRYFHNIKGAASQVSHKGLSNSAGICEMLLGKLLENKSFPDRYQLDFLLQVTQNIGEFCERSDKSVAAEESLFLTTLSFFQSLMTQLGPDNPITVSPEIADLLRDIEQQAPAAPPHPKESPSHLDCLLSLRSVVPLLRELAEYSSESDTFTTISLPPMIRAVKTLAGLAASAGLKSHHSLLSQFLVILIKLEKRPELTSVSTPELLREFLSYLDLVFAMSPRDGEEAVKKIQSHLDSLCTLLTDRSGAADSATPAPVSDSEATSAAQQPGQDQPPAPNGHLAEPFPAESGFEAIESQSLCAVDDFSDLNEFTTESAEYDASESAFDDELLLIFKAECDEHLQVMSKVLSHLTEVTGDGSQITESGREQLALLRRAAHTLKGAAAMTGFEAISKFAYSLEKFADWLHDESAMLRQSDLALIADGAEGIRRLTGAASTAHTPDIELIEQKIHAQMNRDEEPAFRPSGGWKLEQPTDATDLFRSAQNELADQAGNDAGFLFDINEEDILFDISCKEEQHAVDGIFQDGRWVANRHDSVAATDSVGQQIDPELLAIFQSECDEHLQTISSVLNQLSGAITTATHLTPAYREALGSIRRAIHTLKGAAAMTGFDQLASCSHSLEDLLDWLFDSARQIEPQDLAVVAEAIDIIESVSLFEKASSTIDIDHLIGAIRNHLLKRSLAEASMTEESLAEVQPEQVVQSAVIQEAGAEQPEAMAIPGDSGNIRVNLADLDELVNLEGELVVVRGSVEKLLDKFTQSLAELNTVKDTLRRKSQELEVGFEAQSLYGFGSGAAPQESGFGSAGELSEFDPIELDRYSQLNLIIRSLNEISIDINAIYTEMTALGASLQGQVARQQLAMGVMQEKLMRIRMTPLSSISRMLHRTVRQTAAKLGKTVQLAITGDDVYMDRFIWSRTLDPFSHILRNCIDHGIEDAETRTRLGKPPVGQITFHASQRGRFVVLKISDDGQGINSERLRRKLLKEQLISERETISDSELLPYLFRPSISTRDDISQTSGRGVGLDVVLKNIQDLRGSVQVHNTPGKGVTFELRIPITLSVNRAIIFGLSGSSFAVPIHDIVEVRKFAATEIINGEKVVWNDQHIPLANLARSLNLSAAQTTDSSVLTLIIENSERQYSAVQIESIEEQREIVIKDLGAHLRYVRGINGVTLTGEGAIIPILNLHELAAHHEAPLKAAQEEVAIPETTEPLKVLVVDDSISVRYSITRLVEGQSWNSFQAVDGVDALEKLEHVIPNVIVLDIEMPRMNGFEFMGIIRHDERYKDIPVLMLTSRASEKHQNKARELGVDYYMVKPYQEEDFIQLMAGIDSSRA